MKINQRTFEEESKELAEWLEGKANEVYKKYKEGQFYQETMTVHILALIAGDKKLLDQSMETIIQMAICEGIACGIEMSLNQEVRNERMQ